MKKDGFVILVAPSQSIHVTAGEHLGIGYLAAVLRQMNFIVEIIDGWLEDLTSKEIAYRILSREKPLLIGFTSYTSNMQDVIDIVQILRTNGVITPCVVGGYGPTFQPVEYLKSGFDFVVRGEGDRILPQICKYLLTKFPLINDIPSVSYIDKDNIIHHNNADSATIDLNSLPFPARDTIKYTIQRKNAVNIISSKGCLGHCLFCSIQTFQNISNVSRWRSRDISSFVDEIEEIVSCYGVTHFKVVDDSLIEPPRDASWCNALANELEKRSLKVRLRCSIRADRVTDDIIKELSRAGFFSFACGIENFAPTALKRMNKGATLEQNINALNIFNKYNVNVESGFILFDNKTTIEELQHNYNFMRQYPWIVSKVFSEMYAAQNTPFTKKLLHQNLISEENQKFGNYKYKILDPIANLVYNAMKFWNRYHIQLYDASINPLKAVRAISDNDLKLFHSLYLEIHERELDVFGKILYMVSNNVPLSDIEKELESHKQKTQYWYDKFEIRLNKVFVNANLHYELMNNPFIN